jgi:hypothetical protein
LLILKQVGLPGLALCLSILIIGCGDSKDPNPFASMYMSAPTVPGIWLTDENNQSLGAWGNPTGDPDDVIRTSPNPFNPQIIIRLWVDSSIAIPAPIIINIVRAYSPYDAPNPVIQSSGGKVIAPDGIPVRTMEFTLDHPGYISVAWNGHNEAGDLLPSGFYRIYVDIGYTSQWADVLMIVDCSVLAGLPGLENWCHWEYY